MPKAKKPKSVPALAGGKASLRHNPLGQVIQDDSDRNKYASSSRRRGPTTTRDGDDGDGPLLDEKESRRIMEMSKAQQLEVEAEEEVSRIRDRRKKQQQQQQQGDRRRSSGDDSSSDEGEDVDEFEHDDEEQEEDVFIDHDEGYVTIADGTLGLSPEDEALVASMMYSTGSAAAAGDTAARERRNLSDMIMEKIEEKEIEKRGEMEEGFGDGGTELPEKVVQVYTEIGKILSRYTSGKLPKAFKVIPSLSNWEEVLYLTRPDMWTPQAMYQATRIFASNLNPKMAQRFYNLVLLDSVRVDIEANKKLNYHYYISLKKSVYKPAAFFKGILLPLARDPSTTLREAAIVASVLQRVSIPVHHAAVAIHKLAQQQQYSGATSVFIKTLLNKKYSLPAPVIGSLVRHFASFVNDPRTLPVLWHQSLLVFVQRYKAEIQTEEPREVLRKVMKKHFHHKITPEIRRELFGSQAWKDERAKAGGRSSDDRVDMEL